MTTTTPKSDWRAHVGGTVAICLIVGLLNFVIRGGQLGMSMLYAFAIGVQISVYISLLHWGVETLLRRWRGEPTTPAGMWTSWAWMMPSVLLGSAAGFAGGRWLVDLLSGRSSLPIWDIADSRLAWSFGFTLLVSLLASLFFFVMFKLNMARLAQAQAQRQAAEARLTLLQSQLEPHMLFNTLAHLRVLIKLQPDEAQQMLDRLITYLRATLQASRSTEHPLADEFERVSDYLELMQLRMGERLRVRLDLPAELARTAVPPLLLQPLVENAIKHGLEPHEAGGELRVSAAREGRQLVLEVADSGAGLGSSQAPTRVGTGFGLAQVRERLSHRYGEEARFELRAGHGGGSVARIEIPA